MYIFLFLLMGGETISLLDLPFYSPFAVRFQALEDGRSVLLDCDECRLHFYDSEGRLEKITGSCGGGPDSFNSPHSIKYMHDQVFVFQTSHYSVVNPRSGQVREKIRLLDTNVNYRKVKNGWVVSPNVFFWKSLKEVTIKWYSNNFLTEKVIHQFKSDGSSLKSSQTGIFQDQPLMALDDTGAFLYLRETGQSVIQVFDIQTMAFLQEIHLNLKRMPIDKKYFEERAAATQKLTGSKGSGIKAPDYYPLISRIIPLHGGGILVVGANGPSRTLHAMNQTGEPILTPITPELYPRILAKINGYYWIMGFNGDEVSIHKVNEAHLLESLEGIPFQKPSLAYFKK